MGNFYDKLIGINYEGIEVTEPLILKAINRLAATKRNALKRANEPDAKLTNVQIVEKYYTLEDILRNVKSVAKLNEGKVESKGEQKREIKFDDIREFELSLDGFEGYTEAERNFIRNRLLEYERDYNIEKAADKFKALRAVVCELKIMQLEMLLLSKPKIDPEIQKQIDNLDKQYTLHCDSLNALKKQRVKHDKGQSKIDLANVINQLDKSIKDLELEAEGMEEEEIEMIRNRSKRVNKEANF